jgi:hypothetical protein
MMYDGGVPLTTAQKASRKATRERNAPSIQQKKFEKLAEESRTLMRLANTPEYANLPFSVLQALAKATVTEQGRVNRAKAPRVQKFIKREDGSMIANPQYIKQARVLGPDARVYADLRSRLSLSHAQSREPPVNLTPANIEKIKKALSDVGLGIYDLETGGAWYDDLWSGIKDVASTVAPVLPFIL